MWLSWDLFLGSTLCHQLSKRSLQCRPGDGIVSIDALQMPWRPVNLGSANSRSITVDETVLIRTLDSRSTDGCLLRLPWRHTIVIETLNDYSLNIPKPETQRRVFRSMNLALDMNAVQLRPIPAQHPRLRNRGFSLLSTSKSLG
jgi:hypothetical protein